MKNFVANEIPPFLKVLERLLSENNGGTGYIVGDTVSCKISSEQRVFLSLISSV